MTDETARQAIEDAADALGEALLKAEDDPSWLGTEGLARTTLTAGLRSLAEHDASDDRVQRVAVAVYAAMHDTDADAFKALDAGQQAFWQKIARKAVTAADETAAAAVAASR
ncbi:hypothetical protein CKO28_20060 [Rhodovibrio sodomensis]|uniref:Uncharacterized protein n=1 Tax=Rhodovibrio sodomensis TaxID=1088 RepID=A0ABS1DJP5_9PROT|nr:hypothetical protein [Rhodovibrio sodomensis]MBK1670322.1 hypothetical protein [Rhodovibrio sodomensis]